MTGDDRVVGRVLTSSTCARVRWPAAGPPRAPRLIGACALALAVPLACGEPAIEPAEVIEQREGALGTFNVLTRSYNNQRTGANLSETTLRPSNVNPNQFGKLFQVAVDDQVYAQPLYASGVTIPGKGVHNVVYVATVNNSIYAFDADTGGSPLWQRSYNVTGGRAPRNTEVAHGQACGGNYRDFSGNIGIVGTPVIDGSTSTMYFVTRSLEGAGGSQMVYRRMAVDITTGNHKLNSPQAMFAGGATPSAFDPWFLNQRAGLALSQGKVYVAFAAYCDTIPFNGWMVAFSASNLSQAATGILNTTPNVAPPGNNEQGASKAGIWQAGNAPAFDSAGNVYVTTGNGYFDQASHNWGQTLLKLSSNTLGWIDNFTPSNFNDLNGAADLDFGSAGPSVLPGSTQIVSGGKDGRIYLRALSSLGHVADINAAGFQAVDTGTVPGASHHIHNGVVLWSGPSGLNLYVWGENDFLRLYRYNPSTQKFNTPALATGTILPPNGMPGGIMSLSANGATGGTAILWATTPSQGNANNAVRPGILRAFNAETLALLWEATSPGDDIMELSKFNPPLVANGKVYIASFSGVVSVFGPRSGPTPPIANNAIYQIRTVVADSCVDVNGSGLGDGVNVQQYSCNGTNAQRWQIAQVTNNVYQVKSMVSGKCLDVAGGGTADPTNVDQLTCDGSAKQRWAIVPMGNAQYRLMPQTAANRCLDVASGATGDFTNIQQLTCNGSAAQVFRLAIDNTGTAPIPSQTFRIRTGVGANSCVDVANADQGDGDKIQEEDCSGTDAQRFRFNHVGGGIYEIRTAVSDVCMDVAGSGITDGTDVQPFACNNTNAQRWLITALGEGQYQFQPQVSTTTCLDVSNSSPAAGTKIQEWTCNNSQAQKFRLLSP